MTPGRSGKLRRSPRAARVGRHFHEILIGPRQHRRFGAFLPRRDRHRPLSGRRPGQ
jgi:hypothetical protein